MKNGRQSLTITTLLLSAGRILATLSSLLISVILARSLSVDEYAIHKKAILVFTMLGPVFALGLPEALYFFLPLDLKRSREVVCANLGMLFLMGIGPFCLLVMFCGKWLASYLNEPTLTRYWWLIGIYTVIMLPLSSISSTLVAMDRVKTLLRFQISSQVLRVIAIFFGGLVVQSAMGTLGALVVWSLCAGGFGVVLMYRATSVQRLCWSDVYSSGRRQLTYAVPLGVASMFGGLSAQLDKFMVSSRCTTEAFSNYVVGAIELPIIGVVTGSLTAALLPRLSEMFQRGDWEQGRKLWILAFERTSLVLIPCFGGVLLFGREIVVLLYSERFVAAAAPFMVYSCLLPLRCAVYGSILMAADKTKLVTYSALAGLCLNIVLNHFLIDGLGAIGAAWATVASQYLVVGVMLPSIAKVMRVGVSRLFPLRHLFKVVLASTVSFSIVYVSKTFLWHGGLWGLAVWPLFYGGLGLVMYRWLGLPSLVHLFRRD